MSKQIGAMQLFVSFNVWPVGKVEKPALTKSMRRALRYIWLSWLFNFTFQLSLHWSFLFSDSNLSLSFKLVMNVSCMYHECTRNVWQMKHIERETMRNICGKSKDLSLNIYTRVTLSQVVSKIHYVLRSHYRNYGEHKGLVALNSELSKLSP